MLIVNFSHPLTEAQLEAIRGLVNDPTIRVETVPCQFDPGQSFTDQAQGLLGKVGLTAEQWQTVPLLVNLPSLAPIAALVLAELHGRTGYWPPILRLRPIPGSVPPQFEVAEVIDLNAVRDEARKRR